MKILDNETHIRSLAKGRVYRNHLSSRARMFEADTDRAGELPVHVEGKWGGSSKRAEFLETRMQERRDNLTNAIRANTNIGDAVNALASAQILDVLALADDIADYSETLYNKVSRRFPSELVPIRSVLPPIGEIGRFMGTGDEPNEMYHRDPGLVNIQLQFQGVTNADELIAREFGADYDLLARGIANAIADYRNSLLFKPMVGATYNAAHSVTFDTTGTTYEEKLYNTIMAAKRKLLGGTLHNLLGGNPIKGGGQITIYLPEGSDYVAWILNGMTAGTPGNAIQRPSLQVDNIVMYSGGINDGVKAGDHTLSFPGVADGEGYIAIKKPDGAQLLIHREFTTSSWNSGREVRPEITDTWGCFGVYNDNVLPSTDGGVEYGAIIKFPTR